MNTGQSHDDQFHRKDGTRLPVAYTVGPLDLKGEIVGSVVTFRDITDRKQALESLRASEERYRGLVETSPDSIWLADAYGFIVMANNQAATLFGFDSADAMRGVNTAELFVPEARLGAVQDRHKTLEAGSLMNLEYLCESRNGQRFPVEMSLSAVCDDQGKPNGVIAMAREISQRKRAEETLRASEARLAMQYAATTVLAQTATLTDAVTKLLETVCTTAGWDLGIFWSRDEKTQSLQFQTHWHHPRVNITAFRKACQSIAITPGSDLPGQVWAAREPAWVVELADAAMFHRQSAAAQDGLRSAFCFPVMIDGVVHSVMEFFSREPRAEQRDQVLAMTTISTLIGQFIERKQAEDALEYQALHDALTDLPNRVLFHDRVLQTILSSSRSRRPFALLLMDLDHFKEVNDTFGHHYGDLLLQEVSGRIRGVLRNSDTVARLGGDEFAVLLPNVDLVGATATANKILAAFEAQVILEGRPFDIGASIGIAMFPEHSEDANALLRLADVAMYVAKRSGIGYAVYETNLDHNSESKMALKSDLRHAIENNELLLHYQPKVNLKTGRISSVEALVRWMHPDHGLIQPDQFISLAEQMGLIQVLSLHVLSAALDQCRRWADAGIDMQVAVNFSTISLHDQQLVGMIAQMLRTCNVSAGRLQVEITESAVMQDPDLALTILTRLHEMGVHISIDDFGIGHSSLAYIKRLPVDEIKIDKAFVLDMAHNEDDAFIVRSVIELGHKLNLDVVAEGVETLEVMNLLTTLGCDMAQGTYLSEPIEAGELSRRFADEDAQLPHVG